jgi:hypothetical protein
MEKRIMLNITFYEGSADLQELTGLSYKELWEAGFNLDDMDFGIVCDVELGEDWWSNGAPYYSWWLLDRMDSHCVGYNHVEYNGKHYYTVHHS